MQILTNEWDYTEWAHRFFEQTRTVVHSADYGSLLALASKTV
jgi:hypothetical protein